MVKRPAKRKNEYKSPQEIKMIKSMTAFGRAKLEGTEKDITVEIKSVNSRFFDCTVKLPRAYTALEERIKSYLKTNAISRAKIDVSISVEDHTSYDGALSVDMEYARAYIDALHTLRDEFSLPDDISVMRVAQNHDVFTHKKQETDVEADWEIIEKALSSAVEQYTQMREAEGRRTESDITSKLELIREYAKEIEKISHTDKVGYGDKLKARLSALLQDNGIEVEEYRILSEVAIYVDKIAIDEELARLDSHISAFYEIASAEEPSGRKLDFLMQEMNRETNTIGSKANNVSIARIVVNIKGELEKIREQIQNIE